MFFPLRSSLLTALLSLLPLATCQDTSLNEVITAFNKANIPENAPITFNPSVLLEVAFPQVSGAPVPVRAGEQLQMNQTTLRPTFGIRIPGSRELAHNPFVVAMVDLDALTPQDPNLAQIRHFLGGNFVLGLPDLSDATVPLVNRTPALSDFLNPTPPAGSDPHRYVFLLFEQSAGFNSQTFVNASTPVTNFNISQFAEEVGLGNPIGGSFMLVGPGPSS